jgi:hypothetical protein
MMEGVNLAKIYCKHFCKCHNKEVKIKKQWQKNLKKVKKKNEVLIGKSPNTPVSP